MFAVPMAGGSLSNTAEALPLPMDTCRHRLGWEGKSQCVGVIVLSCLISRGSLTTWSADMTALLVEYLRILGVKCRLCCKILLVSAGSSGLTPLVDRHDLMPVQT